MEFLVLLICVLVLIVISCFFSGSETSMMSLNRYRLHHLAKKSRAAKRAEALLKRPDRLLGAILIGNTFATILASSITTVLAQHFFGPLGVFGVSIGLTLFILLFAEVLPKTLAAVKPERLAFPATLPLRFVLMLFYPLIFVLGALTRAILSCFNISVLRQHDVDPLTSEELRSVVHASRDSLRTQHKNMLLGVLDLEKETVKDAMLPRQSIQGIDLNAPWAEILAQLKMSPFSKLPVYRDSIDQLLGILHLRKLIAFSENGQHQPQKVLEQLLDPPYFIPETTTMQQQLINFQKHSAPMAFVVDEYGDIQGLVTVEDILEEIVGKFTNLSQPAAHSYIQRLADGVFLIDGAMTLRDINRDLELDLPTDGPRTLSGLIVEYLETMPVVGLCLKINDYPLEIIAIEDNAVSIVKITPKLDQGAEK